MIPRNRQKIYLATESARRRNLFEKFFTRDYATIQHHFDESLIESAHASPEKYTRDLTIGKLHSVPKNNLPDQSIIIAGDTIVYHKGTIYGKPVNENEAFDWLSLFSNSKVNVISAIGVYENKNKKIFIKNIKTKIYFGKINKSEIKNYIIKYNVLDKAGAFAVQEGAARFIRKIHGDYYNAVGLSVYTLSKMLKKYSYL